MTATSEVTVTADPEPAPTVTETAYLEAEEPDVQKWASDTGGGGDTYYKNCSAARAAGAAPVRRGDPGYGPHLDRDGDGVGCE
ncbi:excalibur calcium-binding domain-containing protein [Desertihabitans brevis]|uniref:excalibur calcium-binding domain-containing protein n=1 Tax=Desertihabitans brevis TaxID=2268447 RepID=UPI001F1E9D03|nr:excalibur calcium-binding domain-containing protein [Desertihabitans brevis]